MAERLTSSGTGTPAKVDDPAPTPPPPQPSGDNVTDALIIELLDDAVVLEDARKKAQSAYNNHLKKAKNAGVDPDDVKWYLKERTRDPRDIDSEIRRRNRIARLKGMPIGGQLGIFDDGVSVATRVDEDKNAAIVVARTADKRREISTKESLQAAEDAGREGGELGIARDSNPHEGGSPESIRWDTGWQAGNKERQDKEFEAAAPASETKQ